MPQCRLALVPAKFALVLAASWAASTGGVRAADECIAKPNAPAPQGEHWFYRYDRTTKRQCWHLGPQGASVQKRAMQAPKQPASDAFARPAAPPRAQRPTATAPTAAPAATAAEAIVPAPATPLRWPEAARVPDVPPSFAPAPQPALAEAPRSADAIDPAPAPASNYAEEPQSPVNAQSSRVVAPAQAPLEADHTFALLMFALALLGIIGTVFLAARWPRRREASDRQGLGWPRPPTLKTSYPRAGTSLDSDAETAARHDALPPPLKPLDQTERLAQALQQLLNELRTKQYVPRPAPSIVPQLSRPPGATTYDQTASATNLLEARHHRQR